MSPIMKGASQTLSSLTPQQPSQGAYSASISSLSTITNIGYERLSQEDISISLDENSRSNCRCDL